MYRAITGVMAIGLLLGSTAARADTSLMYVTPQNIQDGTFRLKSKVLPNNRVEFVIRRNIRNIDGPGRSGYLSNPAVDGKGLGTPVKLEERGNTLTFRFSVPVDKVPNSVFILWGNGLFGEGVTYHFELGQFWKPNKE